MTDLTERERIKCAYLHLIAGIEIMHLAIAFEVNMGRVSEAITAIELAAANPKKMRKRMEGLTPHDEERAHRAIANMRDVAANVEAAA